MDRRSSYGYQYDDEDDLDIHIRQRSRSPVPQYYQAPEPAFRHTRAPYQESSYGVLPPRGGYIRGSGELLIPGISMSAGIRRTKSQQGRRTPPQVIYQQSPPQIFQQQPQPQPVIINKIYNDRDDDEEYRHSLAPAHPKHHHSRTSSFNAPPPRDPRDDWELEKTRKELAAYKLEKEKAAEKKRLEKEIEFERLRQEKEQEEEEEKLKAERKKAIEKYKIEEAEKVAKAKKDKAEREEEYQRRLAEDLRKNGVVLGKDNKQVQGDPNRPTYTRMSRRHLSIETLNKFKIDFEFDHVSSFPSRPKDHGCRC